MSVPLKIIVWGINYAPELTGIAPYNTQLCEDLSARGHRVRMLTAFSYYPQWRKAATDRGRLYRTDTLMGIPVHRCWHYVPAAGRVTTLRRIWHELTFGVTSALRALALPRADVYVVVSPPLGLGFFAWAVTRVRRTKFVFHVQDLQPDAAVGLGMVKPGRFTQALYALEKFAYAKATRVSGISNGMMRAFADKAVPTAKQFYFPNWIAPRAAVAGVVDKIDVAPEATAPGSAARAARRRHGVAADALLAVYSGNLGRKQGLEVLAGAAELLAAGGADPAAASQRVMIVIAGEGAARDELAARIAAAKLANLRLLPLLDDADYRALLAAADVCLITQAVGTGQFFFPSKLLTTLAAGCPVIAVADADSELAHAVAEGGFGVVTPAGDAPALASRLCALAADPAPLLTWAAGTGWVERFAASRVLGAFAAELEKLARTGPHDLEAAV
jgi:colanic acid biosynthesis glycosyl transferase WcaI